MSSKSSHMNTAKVCLIAYSFSVCAMFYGSEFEPEYRLEEREKTTRTTKEGSIVRTDVNPKTPVLKNEEGNYILQKGGVYTVGGTI